MKINVLISAGKAISAWLHGEGSKHFRTYTYPRIKKYTRIFINFGIYEQIEKLYKIVDDTYYNGTIEPGALTTPEEVAAAEALAEEVDAGAVITDSAAGSLPKLSDIKDNLILWKSIEQGNTYRCGTFAMNNMIRTIMIARGLQPLQEVVAIDPLYILTKHGKGKTGTVMNNAFKYLAEKGAPMASWSPLMTNHNTELSALESSLVVKNAALFPAIKATGKIKLTSTFDEAVALDRSLPDNWQMQVSIAFSASLQYFGQNVPGLKKVNGRYSLVRTGGHAVHGVRGSFSKWEDGQDGFVIIDSAYRSYEDGWRFLRSVLFQYGIVTVRFVEFNVGGTSVAPSPIAPPVNSTDPLETADIAFGDKGSNVEALQHYLLEQGWNIPAGATGVFGDQTRSALKAWQDHHFGALYTGKFWGSISRGKYIELKK